VNPAAPTMGLGRGFRSNVLMLYVSSRDHRGRIFAKAIAPLPRSQESLWSSRLPVALLPTNPLRRLGCTSDSRARLDQGRLTPKGALSRSFFEPRRSFDCFVISPARISREEGSMPFVSGYL